MAVFKRWNVLSPNPRATHAAMDGEEVGIDDTFSNGLRFPGDPSGGAAETAGCTCALTISGQATGPKPPVEGSPGAAPEFDLTTAEGQQAWIEHLADATSDDPLALARKLEGISDDLGIDLEELLARIDARGADLYEAAAAAEKNATALLTQLAEDAGGTMQGLEFRLKTYDSLRGKIVRIMNAGEGGLFPEAVELGDVLRYTMTFPEGEYTASMARAVERITGEDFTFTKFQATWGSDTYRGLNTYLVGPDGYAFEVQFHTAASWEVKTAPGPSGLHALYERWRVLDEGSAEAQRLSERMQKIVRSIPIPPGATGIAYDFERQVMLIR